MLAKKLVEKLGYREGKDLPDKTFLSGVLDGIIIVGSAVTVYSVVSIVRKLITK